MGLAGLNAALSGLRNAQNGLSVISNNISNVGTPGFTRKILPQSTQVIDGVGIGVLSDTIIRSVDSNLTRDLWTQVSSVGELNIRQSYLNRVDQFHGPPDKALSLAAELARLSDSFASLADTPDDGFLLNATVNQAVDTANKFNSFADLVAELRNDAQSEISQTIDEINTKLEQIAEINQLIGTNTSGTRSNAQLEDERDLAVQKLAELIDITFFIRGDGVMVVQTNTGAELVSERPNLLEFDYRPVSAQSSYPSSINGIFIDSGSPNVSNVDITTQSPGGKLGGLLTLRDETFPKQMAQIDELAHKLALRFDKQGLRLFTDAAGSIPADTPPDPTTNPPTPVEYIGFAAVMQVNQDILDDSTLLRNGTTGQTVQTGSNEVISRVVEYVFGSIEYQTAIGDIDMRVSALAAPNNTLQNWLGIRSENKVEGSVDLTQYASIAAMIAAGGDTPFGPTAAGETDRFTLTFDDPDFGPGPITITIDLRTVAASGVNAAQDLVNAITGDPAWATVASAFDASISVGSNGQLVIESRGDVQIAAAGVEGMSDLGFAFLGLNPDTYEATDPYFDVAVGNNPPTRITIGPADDENDLLAKLQAVPGLAVEDFTASADGFLRLRPGEDYTDPEYGGGLRITSGPYTVSNAGINGVLGAGTLPNGINFVSALLGTFSAGPPATNTNPITNVEYGSETDASLTPPRPTVAFRSSFLGPDADVSTNLIGTKKLLDFSQRLVNENAQELISVENRQQDENTLRELLQTQLTNESGVNIDEELGNLIVIQTAYSAAARVITTVDEMFQDLLNAFR